MRRKFAVIVYNFVFFARVAAFFALNYNVAELVFAV